LAEGEHSIFVRHSSALKLGATSLLVHSDKALLQRRTKAIADPKAAFERLKELWFAGQSKPPSENKLLSLRPMLKKAAERNTSTFYFHRPFVNLWAVLDEEVLNALASMPGGGARPRPEVRRAFSIPNNLAFTIAPSRKDIGDDLHRFVSFCWGIPDNDLCRRGNAQVVCQLFPDYKLPKGKWNHKPHVNFDPFLLAQIPAIAGLECQEAVVYYCYAMLCAPSYLDAFAGPLFTTASADAIPRLPISSSADLFMKIAKIGQRLANLENPQLIIEFSQIRLQLLERFEASDSMNLHSLRQIPQGDGRVVLELIDSAGTPLFATDPVGVEIASFRVSGYPVLEEWVKWFSYRYARVGLRKATVEAFLHVISRIEQQIVLLSDLDDAVDILLESPNTWIKCPA
jgi:hypothetical protein